MPHLSKIFFFCSDALPHHRTQGFFLLFFLYLKWKHVIVLNVSYVFSRMEILMPCNDRNYLTRHGLGIKECVSMESQANFSLQKSKHVSVSEKCAWAKLG